MSESDTMFNERDQRCAAVQLMLSTDPSYDNRTIATTLKMQIWIATNNRDMPRVMKTSGYGYGLWCEFKWGPPKSAWKSTPKCTRMCWSVWWSPGAIWPVADWVWQQDSAPATSPKRPRFGVLRLCTLLSRPEPAGLLRLVICREYHQHDLPKPAWSLPSAKLPPVLVEKACSQFQVRIEAVIEAEGGYIE